MIVVADSGPLFHLGEAGLVQQKVSFPDGGPGQAPGVVVMHIDDSVGPDVDKDLRGLVAGSHRLRVYVPFGEHWYAYSVRRMRENPRVAGLVARAVLGLDG